MSDGYDPRVVIANTDHRLALILLCAGVSAIGGYMQYLGAMGRGQRDRTYCIPLVTNLWNMAHDTAFVGSYRTWFHGEYNFWLLKMFWFGLIVFTVFELVVINQIVRYSREDLFGTGCTPARAVAIYLFLQLFVCGIFWWFRTITDDPLEYYGLTTTVLMASALNIPMMRARGSRRGMSEFILWGYVVLSVGFWPWMMLSDNHFCHPVYWLLAVGNLGVDLAGVWYYRSLPEYVPPAAAISLRESDATAGSPSRAG